MDLVLGDDGRTNRTRDLRGGTVSCGFKNAKGEPCALDEGHNPGRQWQQRPHQTAKDIDKGNYFTYMGERAKAARQTGKFGGVGEVVLS